MRNFFLVMLLVSSQYAFAGKVSTSELVDLLKTSKALGGYMRSTILPPSWWDRTVSRLAMHDAYNSVYPVFRTYTDFHFETHRDPELVGEAAALSALDQFFELTTKDADVLIKPQDLKAFKQKREELTKQIKILSDRFDPLILAEGRSNARQIVEYYLFVLRVNDMGNEKQYHESNAPGQFRREPGAATDSYLPLVGAKKMVLSDVSEVTQNLFSAVPNFAAPYIDDVNEVRCLGRAADAKGNPVTGPGCVTSISANQLQEMALGKDIGTIIWQTMDELVVLTQMSFAEGLRLYAGMAGVVFDEDVISWSLRFQVNHWRPINVNRSGFGKEISGFVVEPNWNARSGWLPEFPDYPSGSQAGYAAAIAWLAQVLDENPAHQKHGTDFSMIMGKPYAVQMSAEYFLNNQSQKVTKSFTDFSEMLRLQGEARILVGDHFRFSVRDGRILGERVSTQSWKKGFLARIGAANDQGHSHLAKATR